MLLLFLFSSILLSISFTVSTILTEPTRVVILLIFHNWFGGKKLDYVCFTGLISRFVL